MIAASHEALEPYGWNDRWRALLAEHPGTEPAHVVRDDGAALLLAAVHGAVRAAPPTRGGCRPTVGDWVSCRDGQIVATLPRRSLLRRRSAGAEREQPLAANVEVVLLVCGVDRPVVRGRIDRGATLAWDADATAAVVLTKSALMPPAELEALVAQVRDEHPMLDVVATSAQEGLAVEDVRSVIGDRTVVVLGESGAGKSSLLNALVGRDVAATGNVRTSDAKGRHTTTARELRPLPGGGVLIDTPGIRSIGLWVDADAVDAAFADIGELAGGCRFGSCRHEGEPGCAVVAAIEDGALDAGRLASWRRLEREARTMARRSRPHEQRAHERKFGRVTKDAQRRKGR